MASPGPGNDLAQVVLPGHHGGETATPFEYLGGRSEVPCRQQRSQDARPGRHARVEGLGHGAEGLPNARRLGARYPHSVDHLLRRESEEPATRRHRAEHATGAGDVEARVVVGGVHGQPDPAAGFHPQHRRHEEAHAAGPAVLARRQGRWKGG